MRVAQVIAWVRRDTRATRPIKSSSDHVMLTQGFNTCWTSGISSWRPRSLLSLLENHVGSLRPGSGFGDVWKSVWKLKRKAVVKYSYKRSPGYSMAFFGLHPSTEINHLFHHCSFMWSKARQHNMAHHMELWSHQKSIEPRFSTHRWERWIPILIMEIQKSCQPKG